ncbi:MAG: hypothetical protein ACP5G4_11415, partial [bacterium]
YFADPAYMLDVNGDARFVGDVIVDAGNRFVGIDATQADSFYIYDDGDTTRFESDNPIKVGNSSLVVDTTGDVGITGSINIGGAISLPIVSVAPNTDYTITDNDYTIFVNTGFDAVNTVLTLPDATTCAGRIYVVKKTAGGGVLDAIDFITSGTQTLDGTDDPTNVVNSQNHAITIQSDGANWWIISEKVTP